METVLKIERDDEGVAVEMNFKGVEDAAECFEALLKAIDQSEGLKVSFRLAQLMKGDI